MFIDWFRKKSVKKDVIELVEYRKDFYGVRLGDRYYDMNRAMYRWYEGNHIEEYCLTKDYFKAKQLYDSLVGYPKVILPTEQG